MSRAASVTSINQIRLKTVSGHTSMREPTPIFYPPAIIRKLLAISIVSGGREGTGGGIEKLLVADFNVISYGIIAPSHYKKPQHITQSPNTLHKALRHHTSPQHIIQTSDTFHKAPGITIAGRDATAQQGGYHLFSDWRVQRIVPISNVKHVLT